MAGEMRGKTICFIDYSNIFKGQPVGWRIDWRKLANYLKSNGPIWQTYLFGSVGDPPNEFQTKFYNFVKTSLRWEVQLYKLGEREVSCGNCNCSKKVPLEKGLDVGLATKMISLGSQRAFDTGILLAGDRDYLETVKAIKDMGLRVEVISWKSSLSRELAIESSTEPKLLDNLRNEIEFRYQRCREYQAKIGVASHGQNGGGGFSRS